jgi:hypothetical protein
MLSLQFDLEDGGSMFLRNICKLIPEDMESYATIFCALHSYVSEDMKFHRNVLMPEVYCSRSRPESAVPRVAFWYLKAQ